MLKVVSMPSIVTLKERKARILAQRKAALAQLEVHLAATAAQHGGCYRLYGSAARGAMQPDSDVDLLADFPGHSVSAAIRTAEDVCEELGLACDIVDQAWCSETFLQRVLPGAKVLA